jgi:hypothetical protein
LAFNGVKGYLRHQSEPSERRSTIQHFFVKLQCARLWRHPTSRRSYHRCGRFLAPGAPIKNGQVLRMIESATSSMRVFLPRNQAPRPPSSTQCDWRQPKRSDERFTVNRLPASSGPPPETPAAHQRGPPCTQPAPICSTTEIRPRRPTLFPLG